MPQSHKVYQPHINIDRVPELEREAAWTINNLLNNLDYHLRCFAAAVSLYKHAAELHKIVDPEGEPNTHLYSEVHDAWRRVAGRDGAITLFHYEKTFKGIYQALRACPTVAKLVNRSALDDGASIFRRRFPDATPLRHGVAHMADLAANVPKYLRHAFTGDYDGPPPRGLKLRGVEKVMVSDYLQGDVFTTTWGKKIVSYEVSSESYDHLMASAQKIWQAFEEPTIILSLPSEK
jgi:hypothetical protein